MLHKVFWLTHVHLLYWTLCNVLYMLYDLYNILKCTVHKGVFSVMYTIQEKRNVVYSTVFTFSYYATGATSHCHLFYRCLHK